MNIAQLIRDVPDFPKPGIMFKDITTLLANPDGVQATLDILVEQSKALGVTKVAAIESRGFIFGSLLANKLNAGFVPIRKPGKLPYKVIKESYTLEYGTDTIEAHNDAVAPGELVLIHDDVLATGGTAAAAIRLIEKLGGKVAGISFVVELSFLNGREKLAGYPIQSAVIF